MNKKALALSFGIGAVMTAVLLWALFPSPVTGLPGSIPIGDGRMAKVVLQGGGPSFSPGLICAMGGISGILFYLISTISKRPTPALLRSLHRDRRGQAMLEFAIVFPVQLFTMLAIAQMALMYNAKNVVLYSAFAAARSAIVWIPAETDSEWPGEINLSDFSEKYRAIHTAAAIANVPISQRASWVIADLGSFGAAVEDIVVFVDGILSYIPGLSEVFDYADRFAYAWALTYVWLGTTSNEAHDFEPADWPFFDTSFDDPDGDISVQVVHQFYLVIPLVNRFLGATTPTPIEFFWLDYLGTDDHFTTIRATCTLTLEGAAEAT